MGRSEHDSNGILQSQKQIRGCHRVEAGDMEGRMNIKKLWALQYGCTGVGKLYNGKRSDEASRKVSRIHLKRQVPGQKKEYLF